MNSPEVCFICRRRANARAVGTMQRAGWTCEDPDHPASTCDSNIAWEVYKMADKEFDIYEQRALRAAGREAGALLDKINKTDLATLTEEEWERFLQTIITQFGAAIRREIGSNKAPF